MPLGELEMRLHICLVAICLVLSSGASEAQETLTDSEKAQVMANIRVFIEESYVYPDRGMMISAELESHFQDDKYDSIIDHADFSAALTEDLRVVSNDHHFVVSYNPDLIANWRAHRARQTEQASPSEEVSKPSIDWNRWYAVHDNFGFERVEILTGNVGYMKINLFQPIDWSRSTIDATMAFLANTEALIIDLSENGGGYSPTDAYLASYFFDGEAALWMTSYNRPDDETSETHTFAEVGSALYQNRPVYILVSENTFSLGERLAYGLQAFGKATVIGQSSAGAAHAIDVPELSDNFFIQLPTSRNIHPVTGTDWEGAGVVPDILVPNDQAVLAAHHAALDVLIETAPVERMRERYQTVKSELEPVDFEP